jgi:hypothetical protein
VRQADLRAVDAPGPSRPRPFGRGRLGKQELFLVQIIATLDIVDQEKSIIKDYGTYKILQLPTFRRDSARRRRPSSEYSARCEPLRVGGVVLPAIKVVELGSWSAQDPTLRFV